MPRAVRNPKLDTPTARARLPVRTSVYWTALSRGYALGYRKGPKGGVWLAKIAAGGVRKENTLGAADDALAANGETILSHVQAQTRARAWFEQVAHPAASDDPAPPVTVREVVEAYLATLANPGTLREFTWEAKAHIYPTLGSVVASSLRKERLEAWHRGLAALPARLRSAKGAAVRHREAGDDPETVRRRRVTANHVLKILKAALNRAFYGGHLPTDVAWRRVKPFRDVDRPRQRHLSQAEAKRLLNACPADLRKLVTGALLTGCRYGELAGADVASFHADAGTLAVRLSKSGKMRHVVLTDEAQRFFAAETAGKLAGDLIFKRASGDKWGKSHQARPLADACAKAKIAPAISFHILRHTHGSWLALEGVPLRVIAEQLGHATVRITERHYAHLTSGYVADAIRANLPSLGLKRGNVRAIR